MDLAASSAATTTETRVAQKAATLHGALDLASVALGLREIDVRHDVVIVGSDKRGYSVHYEPRNADEPVEDSVALFALGTSMRGVAQLFAPIARVEAFSFIWSGEKRLVDLRVSFSDYVKDRQ